MKTWISSRPGLGGDVLYRPVPGQRNLQQPWWSEKERAELDEGPAKNVGGD